MASDLLFPFPSQYVPGSLGSATEFDCSLSLINKGCPSCLDSAPIIFPIYSKPRPWCTIMETSLEEDELSSGFEKPTTDGEETRGIAAVSTGAASTLERKRSRSVFPQFRHPENPRHWKPTYKWSVLALISVMSMFGSVGLSSFRDTLPGSENQTNRMNRQGIRYHDHHTRSAARLAGIPSTRILLHHAPGINLGAGRRSRTVCHRTSCRAVRSSTRPARWKCSFHRLFGGNCVEQFGVDDRRVPILGCS